MIGSMHVYLPINREEKTKNAAASPQHKHLVLTSVLNFHRFLADAVASLAEADTFAVHKMCQRGILISSGRQMTQHNFINTGNRRYQLRQKTEKGSNAA
jgi:hypothetical protein